MPRLTPFKDQERDKHIHAFSFAHLALVDWSGRAIREGKPSVIGSEQPPILKGLQLDKDRFLEQVGKGAIWLHLVGLTGCEK